MLKMQNNVRKIIWIEDDDGTISIDTLLSNLNLHDLSAEDLWSAYVIITDKGRILKNRKCRSENHVSSFDLVEKSFLKKYRSIYDSIEVSCED